MTAATHGPLDTPTNASASSETNKDRQNQALEQTRDSVLRYGEVVGCELLNFFVRQQEAQSREAPCRVA